MRTAENSPLPSDTLCRIRYGRVETYDFDAGLGVLECDGRRFDFHCTAIADGTRDIVPGTSVHFLLRPALDGRFEASDLTPA